MLPALCEVTVHWPGEVSGRPFPLSHLRTAGDHHGNPMTTHLYKSHWLQYNYIYIYIYMPIYLYMYIMEIVVTELCKLALLVGYQTYYLLRMGLCIKNLMCT